MNRSAAIALILVATVTAAGATTAATTAVALYGGGTLSVEIDQRGAEPSTLRVSLPAVAVGPVLDWSLNRWNGAEHGLPDGVDARWIPAARRVVDALEHAPDGVLVQVTERDESVVVRTEDGELIVEVESGRERVQVKLPLRLVSRVLDRMDSFDLPSTSGRA